MTHKLLVLFAQGTEIKEILGGWEGLAKKQKKLPWGGVEFFGITQYIIHTYMYVRL